MDMMSQMKAIWAALDDLHDKDPEKYQKFVTAQMEENLTNPSGGNSTKIDSKNSKEFESCLKTLVGLKIGPQAAEKLSKQFEEAAADNKPEASGTAAQSAGSSRSSILAKKKQKKNNEKKAKWADGVGASTAPANWCCRSISTQTLSEDISVDKEGEGDAPAVSPIYEDISDADEDDAGKGDAPEKFGLVLPAHVTPTPIKADCKKSKKALITEIN